MSEMKDFAKSACLVTNMAEVPDWSLVLQYNVAAIQQGIFILAWSCIHGLFRLRVACGNSTRQRETGARTIGPIFQAPFYIRIIMEHQWRDNWQGRTQVYLPGGETWLCTTLSTACPTGTVLKLNAGLRSKYPVLVQQLPLVSELFSWNLLFYLKRFPISGCTVHSVAML